LIEERINYEKRREEKRLIFALIKLPLYNFHNYDYQHLPYGCQEKSFIIDKDLVIGGRVVIISREV